MPCILKKQTKDSPGIITFTHNEVLNGPIKSSSSVKTLLQELHKSGKWIFGVHIQGDCSYLLKWPLKEWQSFLMWPNKKASFLKNVPKEEVIGMNCVNLMPEFDNVSKAKKWDICIISRPAPVKRITESLKIVKKLLQLKKDTKVVFIVPDPRRMGPEEIIYQDSGIDKNFFDLPLKIFSSGELNNISFLCPSSVSFGFFPISEELISEIIARSRFVMLNSHFEGTPRALAESLLNGVPCIVSKKLRSGMSYYLNSKNTLFIADGINLAARQIYDGLSRYSRFKVDLKSSKKFFGSKGNIQILKRYLSNLLVSKGYKVSGEWYMENLQFRLPGHGRKYNYQFSSSDDLINWLKVVNEIDPYDEDLSFGEIKQRLTNSSPYQRLRKSILNFGMITMLRFRSN